MKARPLVVGLRLEGRNCLVIGAGEEAIQRVRSLSATGARVHWIPTDAATDPELPESVTVTRAPPTESDFDGVWLAVFTDRNPQLAERFYRAAESRHLLFCALDQPAHGNFSHCALAEAGPLTVAISTGGGAPALAARLRAELQRVFHAANLAEFAERVSALRSRLPRERRAVELGLLLADVRLSGALELPPIDQEASNEPHED